MNDSEKIMLIKDFMRGCIIINDNGIYRPIKNTTKKDIYQIYYEIQELLGMRTFDELIKFLK